MAEENFPEQDDQSAQYPADIDSDHASDDEVLAHSQAESLMVRKKRKIIDPVLEREEKRKERDADLYFEIIQEGPLGEEVHNESKIFELFRIPRPTHWSIVWSDLMMTMFILFAVLYMFQSVNKDFLSKDQPGLSSGQAVGENIIGREEGGGPEGDLIGGEEPMVKVFDMSRQILEETEIKEFANIDLAPDKTIRIIMTSDLIFDLGRADIKKGAEDKLRKIANYLKLSPYVINVVGHTDNIPMRSERFASNWELSVIRATAVTRFLIDRMNLPAQRFYVTGHSSYRPLVANDSVQNRAANRRVEIVVTREIPGAEQNVSDGITPFL